ncbi:MAG: response regulator transcription factor [Pseudomonadota bacterium]
MRQDPLGKTLIVDGNDAARHFLAGQVQLHEDLAVVEARHGKEALERVASVHIKAALIDVDLPDIDGRDLCRLMRRRGVKVPIILLSTHDADADIILGLDKGASDYVVKPFHLGVLLARMRAQIRQFEQLDDAVFPIGPYAFHPSVKILTDRATERKIRLTEREASILKSLYRMNGRIAPMERIMEDVWGQNADVSIHALETHIYRLRQKLEPDPNALQLLLTEGNGYRLVR